MKEKVFLRVRGEVQTANLNISLKNLPNFFIVGAAKAGTTSLWKALKSHPKIFLPDDPCKEPCFFVNDYGIMNLEDYLALYAEAGRDCIAGDASAAHLSTEESAQRIYEFNPDARIIIVLRNPADRAYSLYCWMVQEGYEWISPFEKAVKYEEHRRDREIPNRWEPVFRDDYFYFSSGLYYNQVKRYLDLFNDSVKIYIFEDLIKDTPATLNDCLNFLGVDEKILSLDRDNPSCAISSIKLCYFLKFVDRCYSRLFPFLPACRIVRLARKDKHRPPKMNIAVRNMLLHRYEQDINALSDLIGRDLSFWLKT